MADYNHVTVGYRRKFSALTYTLTVRNQKHVADDIQKEGIPLHSLTPYTLLALEKVCMNFSSLTKVFGNISRGFKKNVEQILITNVNNMTNKKHQALANIIHGLRPWMVLACEWGSYQHYFTGYEAHSLNDHQGTMLFIDERKTGNVKVVCAINMFTIHTDGQGIIQLGYLPPLSTIHPQIQPDALIVAGDLNPRSNQIKMNKYLNKYNHQYYENRLEKTGEY
jgi:hypothetical protein